MAWACRSVNERSVDGRSLVPSPAHAPSRVANKQAKASCRATLMLGRCRHMYRWVIRYLTAETASFTDHETRTLVQSWVSYLSAKAAKSSENTGVWRLSSTGVDAFVITTLPLLVSD